VTTTAGVAIAAISVSAQDPLGNTDPTYTASVGVAITGGTGNAGAALSGTTAHAAVAGVAGFAGLSIDSASAGYTLTATSGGLTAGVSAAFSIDAGAVTQLVFTVQPSNAAAGATITPNVTLVAKDAIGNINTGYTSTVTLTLPVNPGGSTPSNASVAAVGGTVHFGNLFLNKVGTGYRLQASDGSVTSSQSGLFNITPGAALKLAFIVQPSTATAGANIFPAVKVAAQDAFDNTVTSFGNNITMSLATNPGGVGTLGGTLTKAAIAGIATFTTLDLNVPAVGYQLGAAAAGLTGATSAAFTIITNTATQLFFKVQPQTTTAGSVMATFTVEARDASGVVDAAYAGNVTIAITPNTGAPGATFAAGTLTRTAASGTATFDDIEIDVAANNYKLTATGTAGVSAATSGFFAINPGVVNNLVFSVQPSNATALSPIAPQIEVKGVDAFGNVATTFTDNVGLTISDANGSGGALAGTTTKAAVAGVATFNDISINQPQVGHTLNATDLGGAGAGNVTSSAFDITASTANHLVFGTQPTTTTAGASIASFSVEARDAANSLLTGFIGNVTVTITGGTGTSGATLSGTTTVAASGGIATFTGLSINKKGTGYRLSVTAAGLAGTTSNTFTINAGAPAKVSFLQDPSNATAGATIAPAVTVDIEDALGNRVTGVAANVTLSFSVNAGGGTLSGSATQAVNTGTGIATFSDLSIDASGTGYRLAAASSGLTSAISQAFTIGAGTADHLVFTVSPSNAVAGVGIAPSVKVTALDALGNVDQTYIGSVTVAITAGTGTAGAILSGTAIQAAVGGVATFAGLNVDKAGTGYTLSATATGLTGTTSGTFTISPAGADHLIFSVQPSNTAANASITPSVVVTAVDQFGNTATGYAGTITVAMGTNAGGPGSVLSGTKIRGATLGVATFNDLSINNVGTGYTLTAVGASPALPLIGSTAFNIF
jgi:dUTPase